MWDQFVINPMINALLLLYDFLGNNFVLAIAVFTILIRLVTLPLNLKQQRSSMKMQEMQPQIKAIQTKYKDNPQKMQQEFKNIGYNPADTLTGCLPMLIQMPILIGLYRGIIYLLGSTPQSLFELTQRVYGFIDLTTLLPISSRFLWMDLGKPDPLLVLPILVFVTMFAQQKLLTPAAKKNDGKEKDDNPAAAMTQSMQYTMPIMFGFFSLQFQAGLSVYFVLSNLIGIAQGYYVRQVLPKEEAAAKAAIPQSKMPEPQEMRTQISAGSSYERKQKSKQSTSKRKRRSAKR